MSNVPIHNTQKREASAEGVVRAESFINHSNALRVFVSSSAPSRMLNSLSPDSMHTHPTVRHSSFQPKGLANKMYPGKSLLS